MPPRDAAPQDSGAGVPSGHAADEPSTRELSAVHKGALFGVCCATGSVVATCGEDGVVALRVSELESNALVLTSENARVRKELQLVRDAQSSLESRALAAETELAEKQNDHAHLVREHAEQQTALDALRSKERAHAADNEDLRALLGAQRV